MQIAYDDRLAQPVVITLMLIFGNWVRMSLPIVGICQSSVANYRTILAIRSWQIANCLSLFSAAKICVIRFLSFLHRKVAGTKIDVLPGPVMDPTSLSRLGLGRDSVGTRLGVGRGSVGTSGRNQFPRSSFNFLSSHCRWHAMIILIDSKLNGNVSSLDVHQNFYIEQILFI